MASMDVLVKLDASDLIRKLDQMPGFARGPAIEEGLKAARQPIMEAQKRLVQQPGKEGYYADRGGRRPSRQNGKKRIRDSMGADVRKYHSVTAMYVGPKYPPGAHAHLLEYGHRVAVRGTLRRAAKVYATPASKLGRKRQTNHAPPPSKIGRAGRGEVRGHTRPFPFVGPSREQAGEEAYRRFEAVVMRHMEQFSSR